MHLKDTLKQLDAELTVLKDQVEAFLRAKDNDADFDHSSIRMAAQKTKQHVDTILSVLPQEQGRGRTGMSREPNVPISAEADQTDEELDTAADGD